ncbi:SDR family NAD(P)-dependent oxidoreductase [Streptomyces sp. NPDC093252]|uniref:SDR family NAD(P)-dependent oxidoreductase n=1 Tax=Streptomyces sp. NPDC093252 TaxID=3154980 RepID=UPI00341A3013
MRRDDERAVQEALGTLFEAGCAIDWRGGAGERVAGGPRLPSYPWQRRTPAAAARPRGAGETVVTGSLPVLRDHRVRGRATAPAAWMLDAALHALGGDPAEPDGPGRDGGAGAAVAPHGLDDVLVTAPLAVDDGGARLVRVSRRSRPGGPPVLSVESRAADAPDGLWEEHLRAAWSASPQPPPLPADLTALRARCPHTVEPAVLYAHLAASGLEYGDVLRTVTRLWRGDGEALALLGAPSAGTRGRPLPADAVDGAMQTIGALTLDTPIPGTFVGFAYRRVEVFGRWTGPVYAHVRLRGAAGSVPDTTDAAAPTDGIESTDGIGSTHSTRSTGSTRSTDSTGSFEADVRIIDPDGRILARLTGAALKRLREREPHSLRRFAVGLTPRSRRAGQPAPAGDLLLLTDDPEGCAALLEEVRSTGADCAARPYPDAADAADFLRSRPASTRLVCVAPEREAFLSLVRAAADVLPAGRRELSVVTPDPALPPLLRALAEETGRWTGRALLTDTDTTPTRALARDLAAELALEEAPFSVRFRNGERLVPTLTPLAPEPADPVGEGPGAESGLRPGGVYWITGGQGGLGAALAVALAREAGARVVVTGRRAEPDEALRESVEAAGGRLLYLRADAADAGDMRRALNEILRRFGALHGVVHTAGVLKDSLLRSATADDLRTVVRPKETGARVLLDTVAAEDLDFVVLFSSLAALFVTPGQGCYAAANAALDALATTGPGRRTPVRTVNWGPWARVGMVAGEEYRRRFLASGIHPIDPDAGVRAFLRLLGGTRRQLAVVDVEDSAVDGLLAGFNRIPGGPGPGPVEPGAPGGPRAAVPARPGGPRAAASAPDGGSTAPFVRAELARALRVPVDAIDGAARLDRLGVDSLLAVAVTRAIAGHFGLDLPATLMFTHQTLDDLVLHLDGLLATDTVPDPGGGLSAPGPAPHPAAPPPAEPSRTPDAPPHSTVPGYTVTVTGPAPGPSLTEVTVPAPGPGEVVVDVHAVGVNFIDVLASSGLHPFLSGGPSFVPGHEVAGVVHEVGAEVTGIRPGDAVVALTPRGGFAARVTTPAFTVRPVPAGLPFTEAASLLISGLTAIACLEREARLREGDQVLIQAAAGATGTACVQLARHHGAVVYGTAGTEAKLSRLRALGVRHPIDYTARDFADAVREVAPERGLDVIVDSLSGDAVPRGLDLLRPGGRFIEIGAAGILELPLDAARLFLSSRSFSTVNLGALARDPAVLGPLLDRLDTLVAARVLRPAIADVLPFEDLPEALTRLRNRANIGKYVVRVR